MTFKKGDRVLYRGSWGTGPARLGTILGADTEDKRELVYDVRLDDGALHWGYEDQFSPSEDTQGKSPTASEPKIRAE